VRLYQSKYPADVASVVLVDAAADNPWRKSWPSAVAITFRSMSLTSSSLRSVMSSRQRGGDLPLMPLVGVRQRG
jgi:hypothetical protein